MAGGRNGEICCMDEGGSKENGNVVCSTRGGEKACFPTDPHGRCPHSLFIRMLKYDLATV